MRKCALRICREGFGDFKKYLAELAVEIMGPIGKEMQRLMNYPTKLIVS